MFISYTVSIDASPKQVWDAYIDVERWPEFASQFKSIERTDDGPFAQGAAAKVTPHGFPGSIWTVTRFEEGRSFLWEADMLPGLHLAADHTVEAEDEGAKVTLSLESSGVIATIFGIVLGRIFRRNVRTEGDGLKAYLEREST